MKPNHKTTTERTLNMYELNLGFPSPPAQTALRFSFQAEPRLLSAGAK